MTKNEDTPKLLKSEPNPAGGTTDYYLREDNRIFSITGEDELHINEHYNTEEDILPVIPHTDRHAQTHDAALAAIAKA